MLCICLRLFECVFYCILKILKGVSARDKKKTSWISHLFIRRQFIQEYMYIYIYIYKYTNMFVCVCVLETSNIFFWFDILLYVCWKHCMYSKVHQKARIPRKQYIRERERESTKKRKDRETMAQTKKNKL